MRGVVQRVQLHHRLEPELHDRVCCRRSAIEDQAAAPSGSGDSSCPTGTEMRDTRTRLTPRDDRVATSAIVRRRSRHARRPARMSAKPRTGDSRHQQDVEPGERKQVRERRQHVLDTRIESGRIPAFHESARAAAQTPPPPPGERRWPRGERAGESEPLQLDYTKAAILRIERPGEESAP